MKIPQIIERYYTQRLFELVRDELAKRRIIITEIKQLEGLMVGLIHIIVVGSYTTMMIKDEKLCTYSSFDGYSFTFNDVVYPVNVPVIMHWVAPIFNLWDTISFKSFILYIRFKYRLSCLLKR